MTYRELQQILKYYRQEGLVLSSFKLNQKKAILLEEYNKVQKRRNLNNAKNIKVVDGHLKVLNLYFPIPNNNITEAMNNFKASVEKSITPYKNKTNRYSNMMVKEYNRVLDELNVFI